MSYKPLGMSQNNAIHTAGNVTADILLTLRLTCPVVL